MKKDLLLAVLFLFIAGYSFAQRSVSVTRSITPVNPSAFLTNLFEEQALRKKMKEDGVAGPVIDKLIEQRRELMKSGRTVKWSSIKKEPGVNALCTDMGVESGWGAWQGTVGTASSGSQTWPNPPAVPTAPNFTITSGSGIDPCTPSAPPGTPNIPVVAPGFGSASIQIGQPQTTGFVAEKLTYQITVGPADTNLVYAYAVVIQDPGHAVADQPFVDLCIYDQNANPIPCGCFRYTAGPSLPGFYQATCGSGTYYKPWTTVGINLAPYIGQTLTAVITNVDCAQGGHYAHAYFDFACGSIPLNNGCNGSQSTICAAASDPSNPYSYQWYKNGSILAGSTNQCVGVTQNTGDVYTAKVMMNGGCNFYMNYVATAGNVQALFTYSVNVNNISFQDLSVGATQWSWNFGDGNTSANQNPSHTYTSPGTYSACLIVNDGACWDTVCKTITITTVGLNEFDLPSAVTLFPSPASKQVFLDFNGKNFGQAEVSMSNMLGDKILGIAISANGVQMLDVSAFAEGIYFVKIKTASGSVAKKIVVSK